MMNLDSRLIRWARDKSGWLALALGSGTLAGILTIAQAYLISLILSGVFLSGASLPGIKPGLLAILGVIVLRSLMEGLSAGSGKELAARIQRDLRGHLVQRVDALGPAAARRQQAGELSSSVMEGVEALEAYFSTYLPGLVLAVLIPLSILAFVFPLDPLSGLILLVTAPLIPFFMALIGSTAHELTDRQFDSLRRLSARFLDTLQGMTTLKLFGRAQDRVNDIRDSSDQLRSATLKVLRVAFLSALALELLATISTALVAVEIGLRLLKGGLVFQEAFFLLLIAPEYYGPLRQLGARFHAGMEGTSASQRLFEILDREPHGNHLPPTPRKSPGALTSLRFGRVSFSYPSTKQPALQGTSFTLEKGEHLALVGSSGAGKTTLIELLLGFYSPDQGVIRVNGTDLEELDLERWREMTAWVPQTPTLFHDTLAANLRIADPEAGQAAVQAAARAAYLHQVIARLPDGLETVIGERGAQLSGGEAQRLALARAYLKDAPLLILDEPTSQQDPRTERLLAESTRKLTAGRTVITIAHRLGTAARADRILVLEKGRVVQDGSHRDLIGDPGPYRELITAYAGQEEDPVPQAIQAGNTAGSSDPSRIPDTADRPKFSAEQVDIPGEPAPLRSASRDSALLRLLSFVRPYTTRVALSLLLGTLTVGSSMGLLGLSAWLISAAALQPPLGTLSLAIVGVRAAGIARGFFRYLERLTTHDVTFRTLTRVRSWLVQKLASLPPGQLALLRSGEMLGALTGEVNTLEAFYVRALAPPLVAVLVGMATAITLGFIAPALVLPLAAWYLAAGLGLPLGNLALSQHAERSLIQAKTSLHQGLVDFIQGLADLQVFDGTRAFREQLFSQNRHVQQLSSRLGWIQGLEQGTEILIKNLALWTLLGAAVPLVRQGSLPGLMLGPCLLLVYASFEAFQPLTRSARLLSGSLEAARRLISAADQPGEKNPRPWGPTELPEKSGFLIEDLSFRYPGREKAALTEISLTIEPGSKTALVGPSGSGKSTLGTLLLRFWDPSRGAIKLLPDGISLDRLPGERVRELISVVPQRSEFFHETALENLRIAKPGASRDEAAQACRRAGLHSVIQELPQGYDTVLGERGARLSGGELQRLALARALLKDAPIYLLDEPTANLDPVTEREVMSRTLRYTADRTLVLITHRLVGLDAMDLIVVLDRGRIVQAGTYAQLHREEGLFREMERLQNRVIRYQ